MAQDHHDNMPEFERYESKHYIVALKMRTSTVSLMGIKSTRLSIIIGWCMEVRRSKARVLLSLEAWNEVKKEMDMDKLKRVAGYNKRGELAARRKKIEACLRGKMTAWAREFKDNP
jgi:hypothetical protein